MSDKQLTGHVDDGLAVLDEDIAQLTDECRRLRAQKAIVGRRLRRCDDELVALRRLRRRMRRSKRIIEL